MGKMHYRQAWAFKDCTDEWLQERLKDAPRPLLNLCCGGSEIGDVRADLMHPKAQVLADARSLPFIDGCAGSVLTDPPWAMPMGDRQMMMSQIGRILRPGGKLYLYAPWWPTPLWADLQEAHVRVNGKHQLPFAPILFSVWVKKESVGNLEKPQ